MDKLLEEIFTKIEDFKTDAEKAHAGNKAAGARARKASTELTKMFKDFRTLSLGKELKPKA